MKKSEEEKKKESKRVVLGYSMDYIPPVFPFDQIDELLHFSAIPCQQHTIQQDVLVTPSLYDGDLANKPDCSRRRKSSVMTFGDINELSNDHYKKKKIIHRNVERQRRQEMATLYRSLRSRVPPEYLKGKRARSISDHMHETVNYIKHLQKRIEELNDKRDELRRLPNPAENLNVASECSQSARPQDSVEVNTCRAGMEVVVCTALRKGLPLSEVLDVLIQEGLTVVSCISTKVNERLLHTVESEVNDGRSIDPSELQQKLTDLIIRTSS
ncbi:transcription factor bHLH120-like [Cornus florida]|uniref:transcription factor bHLH120-like n=1 Tax=Cornus florida TaxID=4283 RepID=UPI00289B34E5|nr:transcription factor bHLH120-like [Cornus florida]